MTRVGSAGSKRPLAPYILPPRIESSLARGNAVLLKITGVLFAGSRLPGNSWQFLAGNAALLKITAVLFAGSRLPGNSWQFLAGNSPSLRNESRRFERQLQFFNRDHDRRAGLDIRNIGCRLSKSRRCILIANELGKDNEVSLFSERGSIERAAIRSVRLSNISWENVRPRARNF